MANLRLDGVSQSIKKYHNIFYVSRMTAMHGFFILLFLKQTHTYRLFGIKTTAEQCSMAELAAES